MLATPFLLDIFGGRQSARTIHFLAAGGIVLFVAVHLFMVLVSGVWNNLRSMITGKYVVEAVEETVDEQHCARSPWVPHAAARRAANAWLLGGCDGLSDQPWVRRRAR